jgi:hypothetical protein
VSIDVFRLISRHGDRRRTCSNALLLFTDGPLSCCRKMEMQGELGVWYGRERRVQARVPGPQGEAELPVHHVQDQRADAAGGGGQAGATRRHL